MAPKFTQLKNAYAEPQCVFLCQIIIMQIWRDPAPF